MFTICIYYQMFISLDLECFIRFHKYPIIFANEFQSNYTVSSSTIIACAQANVCECITKIYRFYVNSYIRNESIQ